VTFGLDVFDLFVFSPVAIYVL